MATYLLTWNPELWQWNDIQKAITQIAKAGFYEDSWSTGITKKIQPSDRVFLMKLGGGDRGIVASGWTTSYVYVGDHWLNPKKEALYVRVHFDTILDPSRDQIFPIQALTGGVYNDLIWTPQASGIGIPDYVAECLEKDWAKFLNRQGPVRPIEYADEIDENNYFYEGAAKQVKVNVYERNAEARAICIAKYGASCSVCGFNFGEMFGSIGAGFVHVHHLKPLAEIGKGYQLNPIEHLRPVCPNCHAMLHQRKPVPYSIGELKAILQRNDR